MISWLRKQLANRRLLKVLVWLTVFCLGGFYLVIGFFRRFSRQRVAGAFDVAGYEISREELRRRVDEEIQRVNFIKQRFGAAADMVMQMYELTGSPEERARKTIIREKLLLDVADAAGVHISEAYIRQRMADPEFIMRIAGDIVPYKFVSKTGINYNALFAVLQKRGMSAQCFEDLIEERMRSILVLDLLVAGTYVPRDTAQEYYDRDYRSRKYAIIKVPIDPYVKKAQEAQVDAATLKKFFDEANKRNFAYWKPEKRAGSVLTFNAPSEEFKKAVDHMILQRGVPFDEFVKKHKGVRQSYGPAESGRDRTALKLFELKPGGRAVIRGDKQIMIVELERIEPRAEQSFDTVAKKVRADYDHMVASQALMRDLELLKKAQEPERKNLIAKLHAQQSTTDFISPQNREQLEKLHKQNLPLAALMRLSRRGQTETATDAQYGYAIEIADFAPLNEKDFAEKRFELMRALDAQESARIEATFVASLEKNAKIT